MSYLILESTVVADSLAVSREFFRLSRPVGVAQPEDVTKFLSSTIVHPETGQVALFVPTTDFLVHVLASDEALPLALFNGRVSVPDRAQMKSDIAACRGSRDTMANLLPPGLQGDIKPDEFMEAQGWFDEPGS